MSVRVVAVALMLYAGGCSLVTNLGDLGGPDAAVDAATDVPPADAIVDTSGPDASNNDGDADAAVWTPTVLDQAGSLALWLEASPSNVVLSNSLVEQWNDLSKNHNNAVNALTGPTVDSAVINGHDALRFSVMGTTLSIADAPSLQFATDQFLMMAVTKQTAGSLYWFSKGLIGSGPTGPQFSQGIEFLGFNGTVDGGAESAPFMHIVTSTTSATALWNGSVFQDSQFHIVGLRRTSVFGTTFIVDGQPTQASSMGGLDVSQAGQGARLGAVHYGNIANPVAGDIAEIIIVHATVIADTDVANVHAYLQTKYAL
jgi:hypothetical protein